MFIVLLCWFCFFFIKFRFELFLNEIVNLLYVYERLEYLVGIIIVYFFYVKLLVNFNIFDWILLSKLIVFFYIVIIKKGFIKNCYVNIKLCIDFVFL